MISLLPFLVSACWAGVTFSKTLKNQNELNRFMSQFPTVQQQLNQNPSIQEAYKLAMAKADDRELQHKRSLLSGVETKSTDDWFSNSPDNSISGSAVPGYLQFSFWDESSCTGDKTLIIGLDTDVCIGYLGLSYQIMFDDAQCSNTRVAFYLGSVCDSSGNLGTFPVKYPTTCISPVVSHSYLASGQMSCAPGDAVIDTDSTIASYYWSNDVNCDDQPFYFAAFTNKLCLTFSSDGYTEFITCDVGHGIAAENVFVPTQTCAVQQPPYGATTYEWDLGCFADSTTVESSSPVAHIRQMVVQEFYPLEDDYNINPPTRKPTGKPTQRPTSKMPTWEPTTSNPTLAPSAMPTTLAPTLLPTATPTVLPSAVPTAVPTPVPTFKPSAVPTVLPTVEPTVVPTIIPTVIPTVIPSVVPSALPSAAPSIVPTLTPTVIPTVIPTATPSVVPTALPSTAPSAVPTVAPTTKPSSNPSVMPTLLPTMTPTAVPTVSPSAAPSATPTVVPTVVPTLIPSVIPTVKPSAVPSVVPTEAPFEAPTPLPSAKPSAVPTVLPSGAPFHAPTQLPSAVPVADPTATPSVVPTVLPSKLPSALPSQAPSMTPTTTAPSVLPTRVPTNPPLPNPFPGTNIRLSCSDPDSTAGYVPTARPSTQPPSHTPTVKPTVTPSAVPTVVPTAVPTVLPSTLPTALPTVTPTAAPSALPSLLPSSSPLIAPTMSPTTTKPTVTPTLKPSATPTTFAPSLTPTVIPTVVPSAVPTVIPTLQPSTLTPTLKPTATPTVVPSVTPTQQPTVQPTTSAPTRQPTMKPSVAPTKVPTVKPTTVAPTIPHPTYMPSVAGSTYKPTKNCLVKFNVVQVVIGISVNTWSLNVYNYNMAFMQAIALSIGCSTSNIINFVVVATVYSPNGQQQQQQQGHLRALNSNNTAVSVSYTVETNSPNMTYDTMVTSMDSAVQTGQFDVWVDEYGEAYDATGLVGTVTEAPVTTDQTNINNLPSSDNSNTATSSGTVAGAVIGALAGCALFAALAYYVNTKFLSSSSSSPRNSVDYEANNRTTTGTRKSALELGGASMGAKPTDYDEDEETVTTVNPLAASGGPNSPTRLMSVAGTGEALELSDLSSLADYVSSTGSVAGSVSTAATDVENK